MPSPFFVEAPDIVEPRKGIHEAHHNFGAIAAGAVSTLSVLTFLKSAHFHTDLKFVSAVIANNSPFTVQIQELESMPIDAGERKEITFGDGTKTISVKSPDGAVAAGEVRADLVMQGCMCK